MERDTSTGSAARRVWNWIWFAIMAAMVLFNGVLMPLTRVKFLRMYSEQNVKLPTATLFMFSIPAIGFVSAAVVVTGIGLLVQLKYRGTAYPSVYHLAMIVLCIVAMLAYCLTLFVPISAMIQQVTQAGH